MDKHIQGYTSLTDVSDHDGGYFSGMRGLINFFAYEAPNISNSKALATT